MSVYPAWTRFRTCSRTRSRTQFAAQSRTLANQRFKEAQFMTIVQSLLIANETISEAKSY